jgi:hypothetical protein
MRERTRALLFSFDLLIAAQGRRPEGAVWLRRRIRDVKIL